jgi:DNA-binding transcriptional MerR regulator
MTAYPELAILRALAQSNGRPFTTRDAAALCGLSGPRALRRLERRGLVASPPGRSLAKHYRLYTPRDVSDLRAQVAAMRKAS